MCCGRRILIISSFELTPREANRLDLVRRAAVVVSGLDQWEEALVRLSEKEAELQESRRRGLLGSRYLPEGAEALALWNSLQALAKRLKPPAALPTLEWVAWLEDLLDDLNYFDLQETERDQAAALGLRETFRALVLSEEVAPSGQLNFPAFLAELRSALEGANYQENPPWNQPAVQVLRVLEARGLRYRAVAVLGLSEGLVPRSRTRRPHLP